jgi:flavin reductase (DIM6/NTAB) family NADH-FMN oxidoreductase RutF
MGKETMKKKIEGNLLSPLTVAIIGTMVDGHPNYLVIGYICPFDFGRYIFFSLYKKRYSRIGIHENRTFSVNIPAESQLREVGICGSRSGRDIDKSELFDNFFGELGTAPMIRECPINIECEVAQILDYDPNEGIIGRVAKSYISEDCLTGDKPDMLKVRPVVWATGGDYTYFGLRERLDIPED